MKYRGLVVGGLLSASALWMSGCATVPKEAVALSVAVGEDIQQLSSGYRSTVKFAFEQMRQNGLVVIDEVWTPAYLKTFVRDGELLQIAKEENWDDLEAWARAAIEDIDAERSEFLDSLQAKETTLLNKIDEAFARTISANASVTAHLNSVLKVQGLEDQVLDAVGLKDLRDEITNGVAEASDFVADATKKLKGAAEAIPPGG
jgi:hypothetical protein